MKAINKSEIARLTNTNKTFVGRILDGKRNPETSKGTEVLEIAALMFAEYQRQQFTKTILNKWKLNKTLLNLNK